MRRFFRGLAVIPLVCLMPAGATPTNNADIATVRNKVNQAVPYFDLAWAHIFGLHGLRFAPPPVITYQGSVSTACGQLPSGNSFFCKKDKRVYLDLELLADLMNQAAAYLHTDGDYAAIVVAAHEMGHAVHDQLSAARIDSFSEEQTADCFAGVVTAEARKSGLLDPGDLAEGRYALTLAADHNTLLGRIGNLQPLAHGLVDDRLLAFNRGYYAGPGACVKEMGRATPLPAGRVLYDEAFTSSRLQPLDAGSCSWHLVTGGLMVENTARGPGESCNLGLLNFATMPGHVRIEAMFSIQSGDTKAHVGLFFGPRPSGEKGYYAVTMNASDGWKFIQKPTLSEVLDRGNLTFAVPGGGGYGNTNHITVDVHRNGSDATTLLYLNDKFIGLGLQFPVFGSIDAVNDRNQPAGLYVSAPGVRVIFRNFRVLALPVDR